MHRVVCPQTDSEQKTVAKQQHNDNKLNLQEKMN